jgi:tetratricopeptide (TPR) repeat protein
VNLLQRLTAQIGDLIEATPLAEPSRSQLRRAELLIQNGQAADALLVLHDVEQYNPGLWRTALLTGLAHESLSQYDAALRSLDAATRIRDSVPGRAALARVQIARGNPEAAASHLDEALRRRPNDLERLELLRALADLHEANAEPARAIPALLQAYRLAPEEVPLAMRLASALVRDNDLDRAIGVLDAQLQHIAAHATPGSANTPAATPLDEVRHQLASALLTRRSGSDLTRASVLLRQIIQSQPNDSNALQDLAECHVLQNDGASALPLLLQALSIAPPQQHARLHRMVGQVYLLAGQRAQALDSLRAASALHDGDLHTHRLYARTALHEGSPNEALDAANDGLQDSPGDRELAGLRGRALLELGRIDEARAVLLALRLHTTPSIDELTAMGALALVEGDPIEALVHLREANARDADAWSVQPLLRRAWELLAPQLPELGDVKALQPGVLVPFLDALSRAVAAHPVLVDLIPATTALRQHLDMPLTVAVLGEFNAGKSTLINAFVGESMLATGVLPTTSHINVIRYGPRPVARWTRMDGSVQELPFTEATRLVRQAPDDVEQLEFCFPNPDLRSIHFWDTPGFNAPVEGHEDRARYALGAADAIVWLLDAGQALSASEFEHVRQLANASEKLLVVINKIDRPGFGTDEIAEIEAHVRNYLDGHHAGLYALSGLRALQAHALPEAERPAALEAAGWTRFECALREQFFDRAGRLKTLEVARELYQLASLALERARKGLAAIEQGLEAVGTARRQITRAELDWNAGDAPAIADGVDRGMLELRPRILQEVQELRVQGQGLFAGAVLRPDDRSVVMRRLRERMAVLHREAAEQAAVRVEPLETALLATVSELAALVGPPESRSLRSRLDAWLHEAHALRRLLHEAHADKAMALDVARLDAHGRALLDELAGLGDAPVERDGLLQRLVPLVGPMWRDALLRWGREYMQATLRLCDSMERDLDILALDLEHRILRPFSRVADELAPLAAGSIAPDFIRPYEDQCS